MSQPLIFDPAAGTICPDAANTATPEQSVATKRHAVARDQQLTACLHGRQVLAAQWLGQAAVEATLLAKMSDVMRKDVEKAIMEAPQRPEPQRLTRKVSHRQHVLGRCQ